MGRRFTCRPPVSCCIVDGGSFKPVAGASGLGVVGGSYNTTIFNTVTTTKLRLEFDGEGRNSTGIIEWKVLDAGGSPKFPPRVTAGPDRAVVMPGKTYLNGKTKGAAEALAWNKDSGPGQVSFADAASRLDQQPVFDSGGICAQADGQVGWRWSPWDLLRVNVQEERADDAALRAGVYPDLSNQQPAVGRRG